MLYNIKLDSLLFIDIETAPNTRSFDEVSEQMQYLWAKKTKDERASGNNGDEISPSSFYDERAALYPEFGRIVCISVGITRYSRGKNEFITKSYCSEDEKRLLNEFNAMITSYWTDNKMYCGHNIKEFDMPFIAKRMMINGIRMHMSLFVAGKKPWEVSFLDTLELWRSGSYKGSASLELLAGVFGIPTPKDDIYGADVRNVFYEEKNLERISTYCQKDVVTTAQVLLKMHGLEPIKESNILFKGRY